MLKIIFIVLSMTLFGALGSLFLKKAADSMKSVMSLLLNFNFYIGVVLFCLGALINIVGLRYVPYSILFPIKSLAYVWTIIIAKIFLKEKLTKYKLLGMSILILGVLILSF